MLAIVSAIEEEQRDLEQLLDRPSSVSRGGRTFHVGELYGNQVVLCLSGIGKVAAATTATILATTFKVKEILFLGVAGGVGKEVHVGDVVVAKTFVQHDMDGSPLFPRHEVPLYDRTLFPTDDMMRARLMVASARALVHQLPLYPDCKVHVGLILTGDQFISDELGVKELRHRFENHGMAVEMEGAAVAQVCHDFNIPYGAVRHISDKADGDAAMSFNDFVKATAKFTVGMVRNYLR